ncbi:GATA zinc finger domain-containing protein 14-like [Ylistrum balloti]|uniref:GATA zinc finger domain-containing protein 14-like n=1 Tax=Ylistrum balloti TaxID=509963 RepID=UPI002905A0A3|nr:GATA zinc finger domain-containing protein 14-like [Ylistrum balloti]
MAYQPVPLKEPGYSPDQPQRMYTKKPLLPLPPSHTRKEQFPQQNVIPVYTPFVTYPQEYYHKGIAPPPLEQYLPLQTDQLVGINGNDYSKQPVECYPELIRDDCPDKPNVDNSTQGSQQFPKDFNSEYDKGGIHKTRKNEYEPYPKANRRGKPESGNRTRDNQANQSDGGCSSDYRSDDVIIYQRNGTSSHRQDQYSDHRSDDSSKHRRDGVSSHKQDSYCNQRREDTSRHRRNDHLPPKTDDKSKHHRDDYPSRRQNSYSHHQSDDKYRHARDSNSPHRKKKYSEHRIDDSLKHQRDTYSPLRKNNNENHRDDDKFTPRRNANSSRRSDTYNDHRNDTKSNQQRSDHSSTRENGYYDYRNNNCCKHQRNDSSSHRHNDHSDHRNNVSSKHQRREQSSHRRDNSSDRRSNDSSKRRSDVFSDQSREDSYSDNIGDYRDNYDFSSGDYYTYSNDKELVSEDEPVYITTDSIGWPLESDSMSSRGSSSAGDLDCKVYVGQIGRGAVKEELEDKFGRFGRIKSVWIARNPPGFAFVVFYNIKDAEHAADEMDGEIINHRRARVEMSSGKSRWGSAGPPTRRRDSRDGRDSRRQHMYNGGFSRSRSRSPPRYDRYRKYSRSRSRSKSPFENIYRERR